MEVNDWLGLPDTTPYDDPVYDEYAAEIQAYRRMYFALSDFSQEEIDALTERQRAMLQQYEGFSPYADPTTGFEMNYERKFGTKPTFEECKFYDGLLLAGLACHKQAVEHKDKAEPRLQPGHLRPYVRQRRRQPECFRLERRRHAALPAPA